MIDYEQIEQQQDRLERLSKHGTDESHEMAEALLNAAERCCGMRDEASEYCLKAAMEIMDDIEEYMEEEGEEFVCPGCGRKEMHKKCPAHGTPFYMSEISFTKEIEELMKNGIRLGVCTQESFYRAIQTINSGFAGRKI